jgi:hypothetical protein
LLLPLAPIYCILLLVIISAVYMCMYSITTSILPYVFMYSCYHYIFCPVCMFIHVLCLHCHSCTQTHTNTNTLTLTLSLPRTRPPTPYSVAILFTIIIIYLSISHFLLIPAYMYISTSNTPVSLHIVHLLFVLTLYIE